MPVWWYYWARLSQTKISRCDSVTNIDVSHTYYKCKLRPNQNAHIKCFEPNTHIHMHSFKLTPKCCPQNMSCVRFYHIWFDIQNWVHQPIFRIKYLWCAKMNSLCWVIQKYNILIKALPLEDIMIEDIIAIMLPSYTPVGQMVKWLTKIYNIHSIVLLGHTGL